VQDPFPRVEAARKIEDDGAKYFGPMSTGGELWAMLTMLRSIFPFRTCSMEILPKEGAIPLEVECKYKDRPTPCLDFHIQKCSAPCTAARTPQQYFQESIEGVIRFLKGDYESVRPLFEQKMKQAAIDKKFELAAQFRDYLASLDRLEGKQLITDTTGEDSDIIAVAVLSGRADVVVMHRRNGRLIGDSFYSLSGQAEDAKDVLEQFMPQYYNEGAEIPEALIISEDIADRGVFEEWLSAKKGRKVKILVPERGKKSHLLQLAEKNVAEKARQREVKWEAEKRNIESALKELQDTLVLPSLPERIEGYDISHLGGTETVGSMVVMRHGKAANDQYRSFTLRSLKKGEVDDYKSLKEVLYRRLLHLTRNVREEELALKAKGIAFGKPLKSEQKMICEILSDASSYPSQDVLVVRKDKKFFGVIWTVEREGGLLELIHPRFPDGNEIIKEMPDYIFHRKLLSRVKKKVYVKVNSLTADTFSALGFQYVQRLPKPYAEEVPRYNDMNHEWLIAHHKKADDSLLVMVYDPKKNREDPSLSSRPNLLVIDGGKGQLSAVMEVLSALQLDIPTIGLAKREEEVFVSGRKDPIFFPKDSQAKFLLMRLRDEAHRFANRHREKRGKSAMQASALDEIPSVGDETKKKLLQKFGSLSGIRVARDEELREILSESQLKEVRRRL
jgi:excinuclease UvrABC nuclease subunit